MVSCESKKMEVVLLYLNTPVLLSVYCGRMCRRRSRAMPELLGLEERAMQFLVAESLQTERTGLPFALHLEPVTIGHREHRANELALM
jgi:hypothetical protein